MNYLNNRKIIIIGCPGSGKSTFARALCDKIGIPVYHLDLLYWNEDRTVVPKPVFRERLQNILNLGEWIIDGNYGSTMEMRMQACDTVFFLDYPVEICLDGIASRKGKPRPDMPWHEGANEEDDKEFIAFIKNYNTDSRPKVMELLAKYSYKNIIILHTREEAYVYLKSYNH